MKRLPAPPSARAMRGALAAADGERLAGRGDVRSVLDAARHTGSSPTPPLPTPRSLDLSSLAGAREAYAERSRFRDLASTWRSTGSRRGSGGSAPLGSPIVCSRDAYALLL